MGDEQTLIRRVGQEVGPALDRYQACEGGNHSSMAAAIGPLVAANMGLESDLAGARAVAAGYANQLTAAQTAGRDQAAEIERLRDERDSARAAMATEHIAQRAEIERLKGEREAARADAKVHKQVGDTWRNKCVSFYAEIERLTTTVDVLAGRLAARGQS